jgi:hypothetical protein
MILFDVLDVPSDEETIPIFRNYGSGVHLERCINIVHSHSFVRKLDLVHSRELSVLFGRPCPSRQVIFTTKI